MVQYVESFQPEGCVQPLVDGEDAGDLRVELEGRRSAEGISADVSVGAVSGAGQGCSTGWADLREGGNIQVTAIRRAGSRTESLVCVDGGSGDQVGAVVADVGVRVIDAGGDVEGRAAGDVDQWRELPTVCRKPGEAIGKVEVALGDENDIFYVAIVRAAGAVVHTGISWVFHATASVVARGIVDVHALGPGVVGHETEGRREAMLDRGDKAVVVGHAGVGNEVRTAAAARILISLSGILDGEREALSLVRRCGAGCSCFARGLACRAGQDNAGAAGAICTPDSGNKDGRTKRCTHGSVYGMAANVLELSLPAVSKLMLHAGCPLLGIGGMELFGQHDVLGLGKELSGSRIRDDGLREWVGCGLTNRPGAAEAHRA